MGFFDFWRLKGHPKIDSLIGADTNITRKSLSVTGGLHVDGNIEMDIVTDPEERTLVSISKTGIVKGNITASICNVAGEVFGDIDARESVLLTSTAKVHGVIRCKNLKREDGAKILGRSIR